MSSDHNAVDLIIQDHREVDQLFERLEAAQNPAERLEIGEEIIRELSIHAAVEEQLLYPTALRYVKIEGAVEHGIEEHQELKQVLAEIDGCSAEDERFMAGFRKAKELVQDHVEEEERDILPAIREALGEENLDTLGLAILGAKKTAPTHPHPNLPPRPPFNILLGPLVGIYDRMRDAAKKVA